MVITREPDTFRNANLTFEGSPIERVNKFKYLGTWLCEDWTSEVEIKCRIETARRTFTKLKRVLTNTDFDFNLRMKFIGSYVWSVLLYGVKGWTLKIPAMNKMEAFEMWVYRRILKIPWTARITNDEVLRRLNRNRGILTIIKRRKTAYLGHIMRNAKYGLLQLIIEGKVEGRRGVGRKKMSWLRNIRHWTGLRTVEDLIHASRNREEIESVVANIH